MATTVTTAPAAAPAPTSAPVVGAVAAAPTAPSVGLRGALLLLVAIYAAAVLSVAARPEDNPVAGWWPAAGLAVILVALGRPGLQRLLLTAAGLVVVTGLANVTGGRDWGISAAFGVANAAEAVVAGLVLRARHQGPPALVTLQDFVRLIVAAVAGGVVIALGQGHVDAGEQGGGGDARAHGAAADHSDRAHIAGDDALDLGQLRHLAVVEEGVDQTGALRRLHHLAEDAALFVQPVHDVEPGRGLDRVDGGQRCDLAAGLFRPCRAGRLDGGAEARAAE
nr:hypothetical protein [uncultured Nocardioides sp.]